ncbi:phage antirepressor KilAC domain-containing protein [Chitinophaga silvisoli]|uniref:Antirepressor protein C-terminal domain-containing protein n=1 Tax=Chitinophaga silvisoli TaxID=2291814 RepID=A0A3E1P9N7_9BACT|nr:phage antirepressor KilAC domain-containing protein [Chitinophaga silvisoli]RFM36874.1 hypothetical protein DXN04_05080 [Chitinophaga silvisoli]
MIRNEKLQEGAWFTMAQTAKKIGKTGRNKLYKLLREKGIIMKNNEPYQCYCDTGYFKMQFTPKYNKRGLFITAFPSVLVSEAGVEFIEALLKEMEPDNV